MTNDFEVSVIVESAKESEQAAYFSLMMLVISVRRQFGIESEAYLNDSFICVSLNTASTVPQYHFTINTHAMFAEIM